MKLVRLFKQNVIYSLMGTALMTLLLVTILLAYRAYYNDLQEAKIQFNALVRENENALIDRIQSYEQALLGAGGFIIGSSQVSAFEWHAYVSALDIKYYLPGMNGIGYIIDIPPQKVSDFVKQEQKTNPRPFVIHPKTFNNIFYVVRFIEPFELNPDSLGLNIAYELNRYQAAIKAKQTRQSTLTRKIILVREGKKHIGFLLFHPVYKSFSKHQNSFIGWVYSPLISQKLFEGLTNSQKVLFHLTLFDEGEETAKNFIFSSNSSRLKYQPLFTIKKTLNIMQREWLLKWQSTPAFEHSMISWQPYLILIIGMLFILGLGTFFYYLVRRTKIVNLLVERKTKEIAANEEQLRLLIKNTPAAVAMFDKDMKYIMCSDRWIDDYKLHGQKIIGKSHYQLFPDILDNPEWISIHQRALQGEIISREEDQWLRQNHQVEWLKWAIHPWRDEDGEIGGLVMFTEVITSRKKEEIYSNIIRRITLELAETHELKLAIEKILYIVCHFLQWSIGHVYEYDEAHFHLRSLNCWFFTHQSKQFTRFKEVSEGIQFKSGEGLPGRVYASGEVAFIEDVARDSNFPRNRIIHDLSLHAAIGIPIIIDEKVALVLEFFNEWFINKDHQDMLFYETLSALVSRIIERKQTQAALEESNQLKRAILDSATYLIVATDVDGHVVTFNRAAEEALGFKTEEVLFKKTPMLWHDINEVRSRTQKLNETYNIQLEPGFETFIYKSRLLGRESSEWTFIRKDKTTFPGLLNVTAIRNEQQNIVGYLGVIEDITIKKQQQESLKASEETFRSAMQNASIGMALVDTSGRWLKTNLALTQFLGYSPEEFLELDFQSITFADDLKADLNLLEETLAGKRNNYQMEKRYIRKDGQVVWALLSVSLVRNPDGSPKYFVAQMLDISQQKEIERMKEEFIAVVSHELRTPLTSISGALKLLNSGILDNNDEKAKQLLRIASNNTERLIILINDILDIDKIASGKMKFTYLPENLVSIVKKAVDINQVLAQKNGTRIKLCISEKNIPVLVDASRLLQVLTNLISNAAKYSPSDKPIEVNVTVQNKIVTIAVKDYGPGIPKAFRPRMFQKFSQADSSVTRAKGGSGLGLYISKQMIEEMKGQIGFDTKLGEGTVFWVKLSCAS